MIASSIVDPSWPWGWAWLVGGCVMGAAVAVCGARMERQEPDSSEPPWLLPGGMWLCAWLFAPLVATGLALVAVVWAFGAVAGVGDSRLPERRRADRARIAELEARLAVGAEPSTTPTTEG